jgi:hypothetical protein
VRPAVKIGIVVGGYVAALAVASAVVALHVALTSSPDRDASSGMAAFGDSLEFLAVFGLAAAVPTCAGLFFLRPYRSFWRALAAVAVLSVATGVLAAGLYLAQWGATPAPFVYAWSGLAMLRLLIAPALAGAFLVSGLLAPSLACRLVLLGATAVEAAEFVVLIVALWAHSGAA